MFRNHVHDIYTLVDKDTDMYTCDKTFKKFSMKVFCFEISGKGALVPGTRIDLRLQAAGPSQYSIIGIFKSNSKKIKRVVK